MIFSELYSAYYNTVAQVLAAAVQHPLQKSELREIIERNAFGESVLKIEPAMTDERWQLIHADGSTPLQHSPTLPLTTLEKRWLKAIFADPRIKLFTDDALDLPDVEPLFKPEDIFVFDKYADGDPYEDASYIQNFRLILDAIRNRYSLSVDTANRKGSITHIVLMPDYLEYSEKDDKFRLIGSGCRRGGIVNLARIIHCEPYQRPYPTPPVKKTRTKRQKVEFTLFDKRNAMERVLLHFAHFEKQAEKTEKNTYKVTVFYDEDDETEIVIRLLSFGPMVKVTAPQHFVELMKERLICQKSCEH